MKTIWKSIFLSAVLVLLLIGSLCLVFYLRPLAVLDQQTRFHLWRSGVQSKYLVVAGNRIHYFEALPSDGSAGTPLVLIHGLGARAEEWAQVVPGLSAAGFHVFVPDLLGYGRSARPVDGSYSIGTQEKLIVDFMQVLHVDRADIAGWSMGGWIAMKLAHDDAALVDRLVLFDAAGVYFQGYTDLQSAFDAKDPGGVTRLFSLLSPHPRPIPEFVARDLARRIQDNIWVVKRSMAAMTTGRDLMDFRLHAIKQPTLVVWGKQDVLIPLSSGERIYHGISASTLLVVDGCGHLTPSECSDVSLRAMISFLRAQPPISGGEAVVSGKP